MNYDVIVIGGGAAGVQVCSKAAGAGLRCALVCFGRSADGVDPRVPGVDLLMGDKAVDARIEDGRAVSVLTENGLVLKASAFVLATGKFFSGGLVADMDRVYEPVFFADVRYEKDRSKWFDADFAAPQPFLEFGVETDAKGRVLVDGKALENVYAVGEVLAGVNAVSPSFDCETVISELICRK